MKQISLLSQFSKISLAVLFLTGVILFSEGCAPKPGCGNKRDHRIRKKRVKKFAPSMSYIYNSKKEVKFVS